MVREVGVEPTMFLMSLIYSQLSSPLDILTHIRCYLLDPEITKGATHNKRKVMYYQLNDNIGASGGT